MHGKFPLICRTVIKQPNVVWFKLKLQDGFPAEYWVWCNTIPDSDAIKLYTELTLNNMRVAWRNHTGTDPGDVKIIIYANLLMSKL